MTEDTNSGFKSGFITLIGRPNVGKSTLLNAFMRQKIAAVSPRPQTTRQRQLGILTTETAQAVFVDTPGIHIPRHKLGEYMNEIAQAALEEADVIVWLVEGNVMPTPEDEIIAERLKALKDQTPVLLTLNKTDLTPSNQVNEYETAYHSLVPDAEIFSISARNGVNVEGLLHRMVELLPEGPPLYDPEQITDIYERDIAGDLIRESALMHLREEVPHGIAVRIDEFTERNETGAYIVATLFVERESHKGIVIGHGGEMLKKIGSDARKAIEEMSGRKVYLELRVKVNKNWRNNLQALKHFGYSVEKE